MQSVSSRIWTRIAMSLSYDDNHYTTGTSNNVINMTDFWLYLTFFGLGVVGDFLWLLWRFVSWLYSNIYLSSAVMTLRSKPSLDCRRSEMHAVLFLIINQQFWCHFCDDFPQIFGDNLSSTVLIYVQLTFKPSIDDSHIPSVLSARHWSQSYLLKASRSNKHLSFPRARDKLLFPYTCWSVSSACEGVFPNQTKTFPVAWSSSSGPQLNDHKKVVSKGWEKYCGYKRLRWQFYTLKISRWMITHSAYQSFAYNSQCTLSPVTFQTDLMHIYIYIYIYIYIMCVCVCVCVCVCT